jgi:Tol biopolymer transport system component
VVADLTTGALRTLAANLPGVRSSWDSVTWAPDGSKLLAGTALVDAATGQVLQRVEVGAGQPFWSKDGQWLLFGAMGWNQWSEVTLYDLRTGRSTSLGEGLALGWRPDGTAVVIRWPNARYRLIWGY